MIINLSVLPGRFLNMWLNFVSNSSTCCQKDISIPVFAMTHFMLRPNSICVHLQHDKFQLIQQPCPSYWAGGTPLHLFICCIDRGMTPQYDTLTGSRVTQCQTMESNSRSDEVFMATNSVPCINLTMLDDRCASVCHGHIHNAALWLWCCKLQLYNGLENVEVYWHDWLWTDVYWMALRFMP